MRHRRHRGAHVTMTDKEPSLLLLEPCCVHTHRQHGTCSLCPETPRKSPHVGGGTEESSSEEKMGGSALTGRVQISAFSSVVKSRTSSS